MEWNLQMEGMLGGKCHVHYWEVVPILEVVPVCGMEKVRYRNRGYGLEAPCGYLLYRSKVYDTPGAPADCYSCRFAFCVRILGQGFYQSLFMEGGSLVWFFVLSIYTLYSISEGRNHYMHAKIMLHVCMWQLSAYWSVHYARFHCDSFRSHHRSLWNDFFSCLLNTTQPLPLPELAAEMRANTGGIKDYVFQAFFKRILSTIENHLSQHP